jgi:predicted RNase H-like HicB family nuclease
MRQYPGKWLAEFPAVRGAHSWGRSPEEAVENAKEVLEVWLEDGKPLPDDVQTMRVEVNAA